MSKDTRPEDSVGATVRPFVKDSQRVQWESKKVSWIPTSQAVPDDDATVLIHLADGEVWTGFLDAGQWRYVSGDRIEAQVLHWRPFPDAPKI